MRKAILFASILGIVMLSCKKEGPAGPAGPAGPTGPSGSNGAGGYSIYIGGDEQIIDLSTDPAVSRQVSMTVSHPGTLIFQASGYFFYNSSVGSYIARASWSLDSTNMDLTYLCVVDGDDIIGFNPFIVTRSVDAPTTGTYTVYLLGDQPAGNPIQMVRSSVIATYYPD